MPRRLVVVKFERPPTPRPYSGCTLDIGRQLAADDCPLWALKVVLLHGTHAVNQ